MKKILYLFVLLVTCISCKENSSDLVPNKRIELENESFLYIHKYNNILVISATCEDINSKLFFEKYQKLITNINLSKEWEFDMISIEINQSCMNDLFFNKFKQINNIVFKKVNYTIDDNVFFITIRHDPN